MTQYGPRGEPAWEEAGRGVRGDHPYSENQPSDSRTPGSGPAEEAQASETRPLRRAERRAQKRREKESRKNRGESEDLSGRLITISDPRGVASEAYRTLRTNLLYSLVDAPPKVVILTSPGPKEGKSTTCANLGVVLAQAGRRTLILDCDLRKPVIHRVFHLRNFRGVVNVLVGERGLDEVLHEPVPGLKVATVGPVPPNPAELLGSRRFADLIRRARGEFDYVLIDAPPIGIVSDPAILASQGDGVLLVLDSQKTRKNALRQAMRGLDAVGANVLGTVMNNVQPDKNGYYGGYYYGGYTYGRE